MEPLYSIDITMEDAERLLKLCGLWFARNIEIKLTLSHPMIVIARKLEEILQGKIAAKISNESPEEIVEQILMNFSKIKNGDQINGR